MTESKQFLLQVRKGNDSINIEIETRNSESESDYKQIVSILKTRRPIYSQSLEAGSFQVQVESSVFPGKLVNVTENSPIKNFSNVVVTIRDEKPKETPAGIYTKDILFLYLMLKFYVK